ncbi:hypothetical protein WR25_01578 [Diploscapter pachys]|uniref:Uncharacterized protein n=1 Tax=Diploscapter pachys TaxID=2018661 RepID=A0A2A2K7B9_9BILA|nr:hypothetical protein WR25_01578 [Diploscapter pachys]
MLFSSSLVEHAAIGFAFAVLTLFVLAFAVISVVLLTISHSCWWSCAPKCLDAERDPLMFNYDNSQLPSDFEISYSGYSEPIDTVLGWTPDDAEIV